MGKIDLLDCTLRDGGYVNDFRFGAKAIQDITAKIVRAGVEYFEIGFIKDAPYNMNCSIFNSNEQIKAMIAPKNKNTKYVAMVDINDPMPIEKFGPRQEDSIDVIRIIFRKENVDEGYEYCRKAKEFGYEVFVQLVATNSYSDKGLVDVLEKFNPLHPQAVYIVDTIGVIKRKDFLRMVQICDHNLLPQITLGYHSHNNLQQASGNAESLVEMNLQRNLIIDACVFGMGRGAGNLNLELFAQYMNENYGKSYLLEPMLEVIDEYLNDIYSREFWGYSLPFYLSAVNNCHPNYAKYFAQKGTLTLKAFNEILRSIPEEYKEIYKKENAERFYIAYQENYIDDKQVVDELRVKFASHPVLLIGPGKSVLNYKDKIKSFIADNKPVVIALNFVPDDIPVDYIFSSHIRRFSQIQGKTKIPAIVTSNIKDAEFYKYMVNFSSYACSKPDIVDNSGVMCMNLLICLENRKVAIAGLDGYGKDDKQNYVNSGLEYRFGNDIVELRNLSIKQEFDVFRRKMEVAFLTPSIYA